MQSVVEHGARLPVLDLDEPRAFGGAAVCCALRWGLPPRWCWLGNGEDQAQVNVHQWDTRKSHDNKQCLLLVDACA